MANTNDTTLRPCSRKGTRSHGLGCPGTECPKHRDGECRLACMYCKIEREEAAERAKAARAAAPAVREAERVIANGRRFHCRYCGHLVINGVSEFGGRLCPMSDDGDHPHRA